MVSLSLLLTELSETVSRGIRKRAVRNKLNDFVTPLLLPPNFQSQREKMQRYKKSETSVLTRSRKKVLGMKKGKYRWQILRGRLNRQKRRVLAPERDREWCHPPADTVTSTKSKEGMMREGEDGGDEGKKEEE
jgi:hypothetical protein